MTTQPHDAPRFAFGQQVRVIANAGGLYAAQIDVVGVISKRRQKRLGHRSYDVTYRDAKQREKRVIVREDDLEAVTDDGAAVTEHASSVTASGHSVTTTPPTTTDTPFRIGQRVTVHPPADGMEDEYPSFTHYPVVGEIASACQVTAGGVHCYDVRFPRIERGVSTESWPPVSIREAHLAPEPSQVGWLASSAAASTKKSERPLTPLPEPKFSTGELVTVDVRSALCYPSFTRKGAVGKIVEVEKPVRGIRRYEVYFPAKASRPGEYILPSRIREEHLVKAEAPTPPVTPSEPPLPTPTRARHAYEYFDEHPKGTHLWCDAGGCFFEYCPACRARLGDSLPFHPTATVTTKTDEPVTVFACARGGGRTTCAHEWQTWSADSRYRLCRKCKAAERVTERLEHEVTS